MKKTIKIKVKRSHHTPQNFRCLIVSSVVCTASQRTLSIREKQIN